MNEKIQAIADEIQKEYGLDDYILKRWPIYLERTVDSKTNYILTLEWFPSVQMEEDPEDFNPAGSAVIDVDLHTKDIRRIIFVQDISYAKDGIYPLPEIDEVIEWVEDRTGMMFGRQFKLTHEADKKYSFQATVDNMEVHPTGNIEVAFNDSNQLTTFSIDGVFPTEEQVEWEPFSLTKEVILTEIKEYFTLTETPMEEEEKWVNLWHIHPFYIRNDCSNIILPESIYQLHTYKEMNISLEWDIPSNKNYTLEEIDFSTEISFEDAMARVEVEPITAEETSISLEKTRDFVSNLYPNDSGVWTVIGMYPEKTYIIAELIGDSFKPIKRKLKIILHRQKMEVVNYWDSDVLLNRYSAFQEPEKKILTKDEAFEKINGHIEITPVYVKLPNSDMYQLYAKVYCDVVVMDQTGELLSFHEL